MQKWLIKCGLCDMDSTRLPDTAKDTLIGMQSHASKEHGVTLNEIILSERWEPEPGLIQWHLRDGTIYLVASRNATGEGGNDA